MNLRQLKPRKALNKAFLKVKPHRTEIEGFKTSLIQLLDRTNDTESEEFHKNLVIDFLRKTYYDPAHFINTKGRNDLVIHNGNNANISVGVILEAKKPTNKTEMVTPEKLNSKAFQELVLYYLRERITQKNLEVKHLVITNIYEWFIFDATTFDRLFAQNKYLVKQFNDFEGGRLADTKTDFFYKHIAEPFIGDIIAEIEYTYFSLHDYQKPLRNDDKADDNKLIALFKLLSPEHLLKLPFTNDSNSLDKRFYSELLHIIGLTETKQGGKKLIERKPDGQRNEGSLLENAIIQLDSLDKISRLDKSGRYGANQQERLFNVALELSITWMNRVLFLKLMEAQLLSYHKKDKSYEFLSYDKIHNFDALNKLFFQVLARRHGERPESVNRIFHKVPYLNSSLFEPNELEHITLLVSNLEDDYTLPLYSATVLKDDMGKRRTGNMNTLQYLFEFLDAYDFSSEGSEEIQEDNKSLINASVLGLIFEKINGYKDGSFFTPGFITMYMCRETIRRAVVQKFNEAKGWNCQNMDELYDKIEDRQEANTIVNSLKICDPAVGSGHFLVSALNEIIAIKNDLRILQDRQGKRLKEYLVEVVNDELVVTDEEGQIFEYKPGSTESQRVQEALFHEKQTLIENCLFGVDINPNSVKICRLRLWIELLKNAYYVAPASVQTGRALSHPELQTLPNIDINIKCGNSLVSRFALDADLRKALKESKWTIDSYRVVVQTYRNAENKEQKREMEGLILKIKQNFATEIGMNNPIKKRKDKLINELYHRFTGAFLFEPETPYNKSEKKLQNLRDKEKAKIEEEIKALSAKLEEITSNKIFENSFEWRFEFPEVLSENGGFVGFDVVIGNPPYIRQEELGQFKDYLKDHYKVYAGTADLLVYFFELSMNILKKNGHFCMITSNKFVKANYGKSLRNYLRKYQLTGIVDFGELPVFEEAATFPAIYQAIKSPEILPVRFTQVKDLKFASLHNPVNDNSELLSDDAFGNDFWSLGNARHNNLLEKIKNKGKPLGELVGGKIFRGILTGFNKAFIIDENKRNELIEEDPRSAEIIFPFAIGDDIRFYHIRDKKRYIIFTRRGIDIENYPAIKNHLHQFKENLMPGIPGGRKPGKYEWYEIQDTIAYYHLFEKPKIVYPDIAKESRFAFSENTQYFGNTCYFIPSEDKALLGLLNSKIIWFFYSKVATVLGDASMGGRLRWFSQDVIKIPIPDYSTKSLTIEKLVDEIINVKNQNPAADTKVIQQEIDRLVYGLYGLTEEEIKIIEANL